MQQNAGLLQQFLAWLDKKSTAASAQRQRKRGGENIICIAFIHTIIASHVEDGNMKCSYNSWVAVFFRRTLNIFMIWPQDGKLSLPSPFLYILPLCNVERR